MILPLPESAQVDKFIPKNKFAQYSHVNTKLKKELTEQIQRITWRYKLSESTINIAPTEKVEEIQIFELELKQEIIPKNSIRLIHKCIPYPLLFALTYNDQVAYAVIFNENDQKHEYFSDWNPSFKFEFTGINLEKVYQNLIKSFIISEDSDNKSFSEIVRTDRKIKDLQREIDRCKSKLAREKQFNRKVSINQELHRLENTLEKLLQS